MSKELTLSIYNEIGWIALGVGVVVLVVAPLVKRWMHLETLGDVEDHSLTVEPTGPRPAASAAQI